jgi:hypothetical protein
MPFVAIAPVDHTVGWMVMMVGILVLSVPQIRLLSYLLLLLLLLLPQFIPRPPSGTFCCDITLLPL